MTGANPAKGGRSVLSLFIVGAVVVGACIPAFADAQGPGGQSGGASSLLRWFQGLREDTDRPGHGTDGYYTVLDEQGRTVTRTSLAIGTGDTYIDEDNRLYEIVRLDGRVAHAEFREVVQLPDVGARPTAAGAAAPGDGGGSGSQALRAQAGGRGGGGRGKQTVAIYHSHNAESYVPSSGSPFKEGPGDIHKVGQTLRDALEEQGMEVEWTGALHLPHDGGAYQRSRATVRRLLGKRPAAMLDVHRDAIPPEEYTTEVDGERMTKVRLVVGRQNQNREANLQYAKEIKAIGDRDFPGLIKGIFHARGNYNQDVGPRMILLEFGTHETSLEEAQAAAKLMAQIIPQTLGADSQGRIGSSGWRTAFWLALVAAVGVLAYVRINAGSWEAFWQRLRGWARLRRVGDD